MFITEQFARRYAKRITRNGVTVLVTDGDPLLLAAFKELGWSDPHEDPPAEAGPAPSEEVAVEHRAPEQAVVAHATER
jgi:hypothetical protein